MKTHSSFLLQYWVNQRINNSLRILLALICVVLPSWWIGHISSINPLVLGVIASALAENDDDLIGRAKTLMLTLICFAFTTFSTEFLFPYPIVFAIGLAISTFAFTMLGTMGSRYSNIAFASLLISIYSMLSAANSKNFGEQPILLLTGAFSYGIISLTWLLIWPTRQIQHSLSQLYIALSRYLENVSVRYHPSETFQEHSETISDAKENAAVVNALNHVRFSLLSRIRKGKMTETNQRFLRIYFIAQDLHERIIAVQSPPSNFRHIFFHSDVMFRLKHMFLMQSLACKNVAKSILMSENYQHSSENILAIDDLNTSMATIKSQQTPSLAIRKLDILWQNVVKIEDQFERIDQFDKTIQFEDQVISDPDVHQFKDMLARIFSQLTPQSLIFRHAIRLSLALFTGYVVIHGFELTRGYWVLLTILLVCQSSYSVTRSRLSQRISGTFFGLLAGAILLSFFPDKNGQLVLMVSFGVLYFAFRTTHYLLSTIFITLLVLMSFSQLGNSYDLILPRMLNTFIGCFITVVAVRYVLPDWQAYRMRGIMADAIEANKQYLAQIMIQFRLGKKDSLSYRQARRNAHNKDAELTQAISNMLNEPGRYQNAVDESFHFLYLNHSILSHISTLGALRQQIEQDELYELVSKMHNILFTAFDEIKICLLHSKTKLQLTLIDTPLTETFDFNAEDNDEIASKLLQQLDAIAVLLPELGDLAKQLAEKALKDSKA